MYEEYENYKNRNLKGNLFKTGHTYRNLKYKDHLLRNSQVFYNYELISNSSKTNKILYEHNLIINDSESSKINKPTICINYSMNKKKRWLIPDLLRKLSDNELKNISESNHEDKNKENPFGLMVYMIDPKCARYRKNAVAYEYFDNNGLEYNQISLNINSFEKRIFKIPGKRSWRAKKTSNKNKNKNQRINFKNGNRDRNSGIIKRITNTKKENEEINQELNNENFSDKIKLKYYIFKPFKSENNKKSWRSGLFRFISDLNSDYMKVSKKSYYREFLNNLNYFKYRKNHANFTIKRETLDFKNNDSLDLIMEEENQNIYIDRINPTIEFNLEHLLNNKPNEPNIMPKFPAIKSNFSDEFKPRNIQFLNKEEAYLFSEKINASETQLTKNDTNNMTSLNIDEVIKSIKIFDKYEFKLKVKANRFLESVNNFIQTSSCNTYINIDTCPIRIQIKLEQFLISKNSYLQTFFDNSEMDACLIYDLNEIDNILLNFYYSNSNKSNISLGINLADEYFESFGDLVDKISEELSKSLSVLKEFSNDLKNSTHFSKNANLFGQISSIDLDILLKVFQNELKNLSLSQTKCQDLDKLLFEKPKFEMRVCNICYDELEWPTNFFRINKCGHEACIYCWKAYLETKITNMKTTTSFSKNSDESNVKPICCLDNECNEPINLDLFYSLVGIDYVRKYVQYYTDLKIMRNRKEFTFCKNSNKKCSKIIILNGYIDCHLNLKFEEKTKSENSHQNQLDFIKVCDCGYMVCKFCGDQMHFPALCKQAKLYFKDLKKYEELKIHDNSCLATSEGKSCPRCDNYMEKNEGCNHMSCPCGFQFCWLCLKEFYTYHSPNDGFYCKHKLIEVTKYDSNTFLNFSNKLKNVRKSLYNIINEQRKNRFDTSMIHKYESNLEALNNICFSYVLDCMKRVNKDQKNVSAANKFFNNEFYKHLNILIKTETCKFLNEVMINQIKIKLNEFIDEIKENLKMINLVIEFLALLLSGSNKIFRISSYSFKPNLIKSLNKAIHMKRNLEDLILNNSNLTILGSHTFLNKIVFFNNQIKKFILNIEHLVVDCLRVYEKYPLENNYEEDEIEN